jgi:hypothetical protein
MEIESATGEAQLRGENDMYQSDPDQPLSEAVITAIASESGLDVLEVADEFGPLYDAIDPSALDSLFQSTAIAERSVGSVTFEYATYRITVDQTGCVELSDQQ